MNILEFFKDKTSNKIELKNNLGVMHNLGILNMVTYRILLDFIKRNGYIKNVDIICDLLNDNENDDENNKRSKKRIREELGGIYDNIFKLSDNKIIIDINKIIENFSKNDYLQYNLSDDQKEASIELFKFITNKNEEVFGLYGYAGVGKTSLMIDYIIYLIGNDYVKSVCLTSPTNKAVNVMKSKFMENINKVLIKRFNNKKNASLEESLNILNENGIKIDFMTIHKLLNYKNDYDSKEGDRVFIKGQKNDMNNYELIIIDECSMLSYDIINNIFDGIKRIKNKTENKKPKIIFSGDRAQLPAVGELTNVLFNKNKLSVNMHNSYLKIDTNHIFYNSDDIQKKIDNLYNEIINMRSYIMKKIMRNNSENVIGLSNNIRQWLEKEIINPEPRKFKGNGVFIFRYDKKLKKTETEWFEIYIKNLRDKNISQSSNVILSWTNKQIDEYNNETRKRLFNKEKLQKYEIGDILTLRDYYSIEEENKININNENKNDRFYTSEQIRIKSLEIIEKKLEDFSNELAKSVSNLKSSNILKDKFNNVVKSINSKIKKNYKMWKMNIIKLNDNLSITDNNNNNEKEYIIYVLHDESKYDLENDKNISSNIIKKFRKNIVSLFPDKEKSIDKYFMKKLWSDWNKIFEESHCKVDYGNLTVHRSQGSTFYNVFIDVNDILKNINDDEAKRCLYTAITRASNNIYLLV